MPNLQLTAKEAKQVAEDKAKLTEHFIITLPQLLLKVGTQHFERSVVVSVNADDVL